MLKAERTDYARKGGDKRVLRSALSLAQATSVSAPLVNITPAVTVEKPPAGAGGHTLVHSSQLFPAKTYSAFSQFFIYQSTYIQKVKH